MSEPLTINQAIENLPNLAGQDVSIRGILCFDFEDISISHYPKAERKGPYESSIWISTGVGSLGFDQRVCEKLHGKRVTVQGTLFGPDPRIGCGHMGLWPAELLARTLERA